MTRAVDDLDRMIIQRLQRDGRMTNAELRQSDRDREAIDKIIKAIRDDGPATARQLRPKTGLSRDRQQRLLDWLQSEGHLHTETTVNRGNETHEYHLVE